MSNVEFEGETQTQRASLLYSKFQTTHIRPKLVQFIIDRKLATSDTQANLMLLGVVVVCVVVTYTIWHFLGSGFSPSSEDIKKMHEFLEKYK